MQPIRLLQASLFIERQGEAMGNEREMVSRLKAGDREALARLMDAYGKEVYRTAALLLKDTHLAEDISQDVFLNAYRKINQLNDPLSIRSWLLRMTVNRCRSHMRRASWKRLLPGGSRLLTHETGAADVTLPSQAGNAASEPVVPGSEAWVSAKLLRDAIGDLPFRYREVIVLYYYEELPVGAIAEWLGEPAGTVKSKLQRGRKLLKSMLDEGGWADEDRGAGISATGKFDRNERKGAAERSI
ncbi:RNA polymerase sigma factor [Paenibacillus protaetiae]|uniref:Sigma-70 family RNA polymerase sigma factor n=1 Tax=Paenibacillus protaetiae TaxID=2509456 RepID=A0A4P6EZR8_9BACL|nr:sigma-70 family RNA polymerase sigma factor [Paenibacillus protaetiae]QAY67813.1 sigma-70 family RNA polymerase sigma factor [Paenibacillus protaetiae]